MRWVATILSLAGGLLVAAGAYLAQVGFVAGGLGSLLLAMPPISRIVMFVILASSVAVLFVGASAIRRGAARESLLTMAAFGLPLLGALTAAYEGLGIRAAMTAAHVTDLRVIAPSVGEAALVAAAGFLAGAIAAALGLALELRRAGA